MRKYAFINGNEVCRIRFSVNEFDEVTLISQDFLTTKQIKTVDELLEYPNFIYIRSHTKIKQKLGHYVYTWYYVSLHDMDYS